MRISKPIRILSACIALVLAMVHSAVAGNSDCMIEPRQVLEIRSPVEGLIDKMYVDRGDLVRKGQVVAEIDSSIERAAAAVAKQRASMLGPIESGKSRVEFTASKSKRAQEMLVEKYVSTEAAEQAATEHRLALADLRDAEDNKRVAELEYRRQMEIIRLKTIRSPVDAVVVERILNVGELAEAGVGRKPLLKLAEIGTLYVEAVLPASEFGKVKRGLEAEVVPEVPAGSRYRATVRTIDRVLDASSGTFGVRLELPNPSRTIVAGTRCTVTFQGIDTGLGAKSRIVPREIQRPGPGKSDSSSSAASKGGQ